MCSAGCLFVGAPKAETAAKVDLAIERELLERLKQAVRKKKKKGGTDES